MISAPAPGGGGSPGTLPVAGATLWLAPGFGQYTDAGSTPVSSDGDLILQWNDQSGNGYHATQAAYNPIFGPFPPAYRPGVTNRGKATAGFRTAGASGNHNNYWLDLPNALGTALVAAGEAEMFVVFKNADANTGGAVTSRGAWHLGTAGSSFLLWVDGLIYEGFGTNSRKNSISPGGDLSSAFHVYDVWSKTNDYGILLDNSSLFSTSTNTVAFNTTSLKFGHDDSGFDDFSAWVSEIIIFPFKLGSTDRGLMYTYLT
jgi:hypothetical protein